MKTIYVVRHAKADGQHFDAKLTESGKEQAHLLKSFFKDKQIEIIYSSPFIRAIETIKPLAQERGLQIVEDARLGERVLSSEMFPDWQDKLQKSFDDFELVYEGGESQTSGMKRAQEMIQHVLKLQVNSIVLVSHGNLSTLLLRYFDQKIGFKDLMKMSNPDVFEITVENEKTALRRLWEEQR
ncbi:histidine phosphatase family protein [Cytobacillus gottheilii]|uniref:Histidine phosphatase family protein n=1 Tax=Cytobacillus gottheilii TaxID=859144 RepID=A0ABX8F732_9BACI|nr:histidine phosphatase family protein [Cytobacillus gottheilii]QVY60260.1 histidine phosphatase family protein [Cytobacillus gottheilii]